MPTTKPSFTRHRLDDPTHGLIVRLSSKRSQIRADERFAVTAAGRPTAAGVVRERDETHAEVLLDLLHARLRVAPGTPIARSADGAAGAEHGAGREREGERR